MTAFAEIDPRTWSAIGLLLDSDNLRSEAALRREQAGDADLSGFAQELEALVREVHRAAQYSERVEVLGRLASLHPIGTVQWMFAAETIAQVVDAIRTDTERSSWDERAEQAFGA